MLLNIEDRAELKRIRKLLTSLDNSTVSFPVVLYRGVDQTVAFMHGNMDRELSVRTRGTTQHYQMSDRPGARLEWVDKEVDEVKERVDALIRRKRGRGNAPIKRGRKDTRLDEYD